MQITESTNILRNLLHNADYARQVAPFLKPDYFSGADKELFAIFNNYYTTYNTLPTFEAMHIELERKTFQEDFFEVTKDILTELKDRPEADNILWMVEQTEKYCRDKALYNAMQRAIEILEKKGDKNDPYEIIPDLISEALSVSFDQHLGHDYTESAQERFKRLKNKEAKIRFHLDMFNKITHGGYERKTLNIILGGVNVGKTLVLCDFAANDFLAGRNVLYITMEMSEEKIANRIDANLMNIALDDFENLTEESFMSRLERIKSKTAAKLKIKEYPTSGAHVGHFRYLLKELKMKEGFVPDVIYIDYINICSSSKIKSKDNSYGYVKSICEEIRGLAVEFNVPIWSGTQLTRSGFTDSDPDMDSIAESFGLAATADFIAVIYTNEIVEQLGQFIVKQIKSRYGNKSGTDRRFMIGVDKPKQKLYDAPDSAQTLQNDQPASAAQQTSQKPFDFGPKFNTPATRDFSGINV